MSFSIVDFEIMYSDAYFIQNDLGVFTIVNIVEEKLFHSQEENDGQCEPLNLRFSYGG